jgi:hypothetical protein
MMDIDNLVRRLREWGCRNSLGDLAADAIEQLNAEREELRQRCAEAYQLAGVVGAPLRFLDALGDAANGEIGKRFVGDLLPVAAEECDEIAKLRRELEEARKDAIGYRKAVLDLSVRGYGVMRPKWLIATIQRALDAVRQKG